MNASKSNSGQVRQVTSNLASCFIYSVSTQFGCHSVCVCGGCGGRGGVSKQETFQYQTLYFDGSKIWDIMKHCFTGKSADLLCRRIGGEILVKNKNGVNFFNFFFFFVFLQLYFISFSSFQKMELTRVGTAVAYVGDGKMKV